MLLPFTPERDTACILQGCLLYKYPRRQSQEQRPLVPLLPRCAKMRRTEEELSGNSQTTERERVLASCYSSGPIPGGSTGQCRLAMLCQRKALEPDQQAWQRQSHMAGWLLLRSASSKFHSKTWIIEGTEKQGTMCEQTEFPLTAPLPQGKEMV